MSNHKHPNMRNSLIENVARRWLEADSPSVQAWLAKANLPDDQKQRLLKRPQPHRQAAPSPCAMSSSLRRRLQAVFQSPASIHPI